MRTAPFRPVVIVAAACTAFVLMFNAQAPSASQIPSAPRASAGVIVAAPAARAGADFPAAWEQAAKRHGAWLYGRQARAEARKAAQERRARIEAQRRSHAQDGPSSQGGGGYHGSIPDLIRRVWGSASGCALRIAYRESRFDPHAYNRSGAAGLFQLMPIWYRGHWHFDPFSAYLNTFYAHRLYLMAGWGPWGGCP